MLKRILTLLLIITSLSTDLSYSSPNIRSSIAGKRSDNLNYKLTKNVFPEHYTLKISPQFNNNTFTGYVKILIHVRKPTYNITLHQKDLNITKEKIHLTTMNDLVIKIENAGGSGTKEQEFYTISFLKILTEDTYYLHIPEFYGVLNYMNRGFYYAHYTDENRKLCTFATTKFESTSARYAFPCFDEPSFRAKFKIYIVRPSNYFSISNTKLIKSIELNSGLYEDEFEDTVSMSTYLVAYIVSEMKVSPHRDTNFHQILARPEVINKGYEIYSLNASMVILQTLETYLNLNYSMNKMDQAAIPNDFYMSGATENWGLVMYRESNLLLTPQTTTKDQMYIDTIIAHEFAHQWFGNLVAIDWWRYLWMKEGFAKFLESRIIDKIKPEWRKMEQFLVVEKHGVLRTDSFKSTRDMNQDAGTPTEIRSLYDEIAYKKSACIIHMLETILTPNVFKRGLTNFLQDRAFRTCTPVDLYRNLQKSLDNSTIKLPRNLNIGKIMTKWDSQKGYPLVYVQRNYDKSPKIVKLMQSPFVYNEVATSKPTTWYIPINYASESNPNFNNTRFSNWLLKSNETIAIKNLKPDDWLILNKQEAYYYRVNYDLKNWKLIAKALKDNYRNIHVLNRAQIIDDSFNLAKMDKLRFSIPLEISSYLHQEDDYITHYVFLHNMIYIEKILRGAYVKPYFQNYVIRSLKLSYKRLGNNPRANDTQIDKLHRNQVVSWMCKFNYSLCRVYTWKTFNQWRKNNKSLDVDLENEIMCNAMRHGSEDDWNYLFRKFEAADYGDFRRNALESLGCTENVSLLQRLIKTSLKSNKYFLKVVLNLINKQGLIGSQVARNYVAENFNLLHSKFTNSTILKLLNSITSYFTTKSELEQFTKLLRKNRTLDLIFSTFLKRTRSRIFRNQTHLQQISEFFYNNREKFTDQIRSGGSLCRAIPNVFAFIFYSLIVIIFYIQKIMSLSVICTIIVLN